MLIQCFVAIVKHDDEEIVAGVGSNKRLVEIQRDSFLSKPEHIEWVGQIQEFRFETKFLEKLSEHFDLIIKPEEKKDDKKKEK